MIGQLSLGLAALIAVALLSVAGKRLGAATPTVMLAAGAAIAFVPGVPTIAPQPELVLLVLLPPLLYSSGVNMSWRGFRFNLRPILLLAIGCVLFTASAVAAVAHYALGFSWALGFVLGAIVSPPDAVAPMAVLRRFKPPKRIVTVLEGESLVNDATALVTFSFALAAVETGTFNPVAAAASFSAIVVGEIGWGLLLGWALLRIRRQMDDPRAEILLALATPYLVFWPPHVVGGSGVVAAVTAGLWVSWNGPPLIRSATRLQGFFIWDLVVWTAEAVAFFVSGLETPSIFAGRDEGWEALIFAGAAVTVAIILVRFVWVFPATYLPRLIPAIGRRDPAPNWRWPLFIGFVGLRGAVSLAAALSIPLTLGAEPFPHRGLILFVTVCTIAVTLIGGGSALSFVVKALGLDRAGRREAAEDKRQEQKARLEGLDAVMTALDNKAMCATTTPRAVAYLKRNYGDRRTAIAVSADTGTPDDPVAESAELELRLLDIERKAIAVVHRADRLDDDARRRIERELDLEEARVRHATASGATRELEEGA